MLIEINFKDDEKTSDHQQMINQILTDSMERFVRRITRVVVHVSDLNGPKGGEDKRCAIEARLAKNKPIAVVADGYDIQDCVTQASHKLVGKISTVLGKEKNNE
jgi:hypothetical protein